MPATLTTANNIAKEVYGPRIAEQLQNEVVTIARLERTSDGVTSEVGGKYVTFPVRTGRNQGIGYRGENEALQSAGQQGWESVRIGLRYGYGRVNLSGPSMDLIDSNFQAFASLMTREMEGLKDDIRKDINRIVYGNGDGSLAVTAAAGTTSASYTATNIQYLEVGQKVDIVTPSTGAVKASNLTINAINDSTNVVTLSTTATWAIGDALVRTGNGRNSSVNREPNGLGGIITDSGVLQNIDPATVPIWKAYRYHNSGTARPLSESDMIRVADENRRRGGKVSVIFTDLASRRAYFNLMTQQRRFTNTKEFAGGFSGLPFNYGAREIPVVEDVDAPPGKMWYVDESSLKIYRSKDWHWAAEDGNVWKWVSGYDQWEAILRCYWELGVDKRNANATYEDITGN